MINNFIKDVLKKIGISIHRHKKGSVHINEQDFTPFASGENLQQENILYYEGLKRSQNVQSDNFSKRLRYYSLQQIINYILKKDETNDFVECGCWKGHSSYIISKLISKSNKKINFHIFDSFEGLSESTPNDKSFFQKNSDEKIKISKHFVGSEDFLKKEVLNEFDFVKIYKGWIPNRFKDVENYQFSFVHLDVDLYEPTYESLKFFYPKLKKGGVIICDEYNFTSFPGAKIAWDNYFKDKEFSFFFKVPFGSCFVIK